MRLPDFHDRGLGHLEENLAGGLGRERERAAAKSWSESRRPERFTETASSCPASCNALTSAEQTFTVTGLTTADKVIVNIPASMTAGIGLVGARVSAADTLALLFMNCTAGALTPTSGTYTVVAIRS